MGNVAVVVGFASGGGGGEGQVKVPPPKAVELKVSPKKIESRTRIIRGN